LALRRGKTTPILFLKGNIITQQDFAFQYKSYDERKIELTQQTIIIENGILKVHNFETSDPQVVAAIQAAEAEGRDLTDYLDNAIAIGVKALLATGVSIGVEALTDEISRTKNDMKTVSQTLENSMTQIIQEVSGEEGTMSKNVKALLKDFEFKLSEMTGNEKSPIRAGIKAQVEEMATKLVEALTTVSSLQSARIAKMLDPTDPESPLRALSNNIDVLSAEFRLVKEELSLDSAVADALENTAKSGLPYEDSVIFALQKVAGLAGDSCTATGGQEGFIKRRFSGDGVVEIKQGERLIGRIVAEAKNTKLALSATGKTDKSWLRNAEDCKANRGAIAFLGLCKNMDDMPNGSRVLMVDRLTWILAYNPEIDNPEILFLVYQMLKTNTQIAAGELKADTVAAVNLLIDDALTQIETITQMAKKTATIETLGREVNSEIRDLQKHLFSRVKSIREAMQPDLLNEGVLELEGHQTDELES